jgi:glycosyltransferase involved in cell wall biosynthesis
MCGENIEWSNDRLRAWIGEGPDGPFGSRLRLTGRRHDLHAVYPAFDVSGTSSLGEGFPNVVGEAMACGVPCVVTDVGDSRQIVGDTGLVVPPGDPAALAAAWEEVLRTPAAERRELGARARKRIEDNYSMKAIARRYEELYTRVYESFYGEEA